MSSAEVVAGTTVTTHPAAARLRRMLRFIPKSYATTRKSSSPSRGRRASVPFSTGTRWEARPALSARGSKLQGDSQVTSRARSSPIIDREARALATSEAGSRSTAETTPRLAPWVRRWRVSARVSISSIPTMPCSSR